jgi:hypothetical protein
VSVPPASASSATSAQCTGTATWSLGATSLTATYTNLQCENTQVSAALQGLFPAWSASGTPTTSTVTVTYSYSPIVGMCDGTLGYASGGWSGTGVLKNDGNFNTEVSIAATNQSNQEGADVEADLGVLQNACSPSFTTPVVIIFSADVSQ